MIYSKKIPAHILYTVYLFFISDKLYPALYFSSIIFFVLGSIIMCLIIVVIIKMSYYIYLE